MALFCTGNRLTYDCSSLWPVALKPKLSCDLSPVIKTRTKQSNLHDIMRIIADSHNNSSLTCAHAESAFLPVRVNGYISKPLAVVLIDGHSHEFKPMCLEFFLIPILVYLKYMYSVCLLYTPLLFAFKLGTKL